MRDIYILRIIDILLIIVIAVILSLIIIIKIIKKEKRNRELEKKFTQEKAKINEAKNKYKNNTHIIKLAKAAALHSVDEIDKQFSQFNGKRDWLEFSGSGLFIIYSSSIRVHGTIETLYYSNEGLPNIEDDLELKALSYGLLELCENEVKVLLNKKTYVKKYEITNNVNKGFGKYEYNARILIKVIHNLETKNEEW